MENHKKLTLHAVAILTPIPFRIWTSVQNEIQKMVFFRFEMDFFRVWNICFGYVLKAKQNGIWIPDSRYCTIVEGVSVIMARIFGVFGTKICYFIRKKMAIMVLWCTILFSKVEKILNSSLHSIPSSSPSVKI